MAAFGWAVLAACGPADDPSADADSSDPAGASGIATRVVTADIQAGIEAHIAERTRLGGGRFRLPHEGAELRLELVRVHTEYLATLGPARHFACVDMADVDGDMYDVDFFLEGAPGAMKVTETTIHKCNGQPLYAWEQKPDRTWHRVAVEDADDRLLGVLTGTDEFRFRYAAALPELADTARVWIPMPASDAFQTVETMSIDVPTEHRILEDDVHGNRILFFEVEPEHADAGLEIRYRVRRIEKPAYEATETDLERFLEPERLVPLGDDFRRIAEEAVAGKDADLARARALYDHVMDRMRYVKVGEGWGRGDATYACDAASGNCTDFHAYFIALARSIGIPARFAIGASIPSERDEGGIAGYHCWAEFHADGKWWPIDISEADKCSSLASYYFGHQPANRVELSRGRDLVVEPGPKAGPINFHAYPVLEVGGEPAEMASVAFSFQRVKRSSP